MEDPERRDELESHALYDLLGQTVAPRFYDTGPDGLPRRWLEMVGHTPRALGPRVQASRMVREYVEELYIPAAQASRVLSEGAVAAPRGVEVARCLLERCLLERCLLERCLLERCLRNGPAGTVPARRSLARAGRSRSRPPVSWPPGSAG